MVEVTKFPAIYRVPGFAGVGVPGGVGGKIGKLGPVLFRFPRDHFVTGLLVLPRSGLVTDLALLSVSTSDNDQIELAADGRGGGFFAELMALHGRGFHPFGLQRPVVAGDEWPITIGNSRQGGAAIVLAGVFLYVEAP